MFAGCVAVTGCASGPVPPPVMSKAQLGSVIIYRNGVAYFERHLPAGERELTLRVPAERVDDLLKSLTIVDDKTGETMPVSYPTLNDSGGDVEMTIELPKNHNGLRISYVTESPAWKPSYRLMLGKDGKATLQGWAVVDNISGEDWKHVRVGVGSTSALSFRYDLHSVRTVHREELSSGSLLAVAPPTGGTPYTVAVESKKIVLNFKQSDIGGLDELDTDRTLALRTEQQGQPFGDSGVAGLGVRGGEKSGHGYGRYGTTPKPSPAPRVRTGGRAAASAAPAQPAPNYYRGSKGRGPRTASGARAQQMVTGLSNRLKANKRETIRVEGFAKNGDKDAKRASLARANKLRDQLIANGVDPNQVEAIGTGEVNNREGLRVVSKEETKAADKNRATTSPDEPAIADDGQPLGQAHFVSSEAMTIERDHSAMVSIINAAASAQRVYFYDPISARGSDKFAFNAVRMTNPSKYTLDSGPFTVYVEGQFLGEGLTEPILPNATAFIPYALDRNIIVEPEITGREEIDRLLTIQRGIVSTESRRIRKTKLVITNRGQDEATVFVRHKVAPGHKLSTLGPEVHQPEKLAGAHLFQVKTPAARSVDLTIEEWTPIERTVDIRNDHGIKAIGLYLKAAKISDELKAQLEAIVKRHTERANLVEKISTLEEQMRVYRTRVDEINVQLVTLRKLPQAAKLRKHLAGKMEEISERLQTSTMKLADMKADLMTQRIELQDALAELALKEKTEDQLARKE